MMSEVSDLDVWKVKDRKVCPVMSRSGETAYCVGRDCAWWVGGQCAIARLSEMVL